MWLCTNKKGLCWKRRKLLKTNKAHKRCVNNNQKLKAQDSGAVCSWYHSVAVATWLQGFRSMSMCLWFDLHSLLTTASFESRADWESILIAAIASVAPQWCVQNNELLANRTCFAADLTRRWCFSSRYKWFHSSEIHRWHLLGRRYGIEMD